MITSRPARLKGFSYRGPHRYFLTACTNYRVAAFTDASNVDAVCEQLLRTSAQFDLAVVAYCFMPDHLHALIHGRTASANFREFARRFKQTSSYLYARNHAGVRLWQPGYYERVLREDETSLFVVRYILENPIRAGLAQSLDEYAFAGSALYTIEQLAEAVASGIQT